MGSGYSSILDTSSQVARHKQTVKVKVVRVLKLPSGTQKRCVHCFRDRSTSCMPVRKIKLISRMKEN